MLDKIDRWLCWYHCARKNGPGTDADASANEWVKVGDNEVDAGRASECMDGGEGEEGDSGCMKK